MRIGRFVRERLGPFEHPAAEAYRRLFLDPDGFVRQIASWISPKSIIEVGCGDGMITTRLARAFPAARILAIDIAAAPGRLFRGPAQNVQFRSCAIEDAVEAGDRFDLVLVADVLHHVPAGAQLTFLRQCSHTLAPDGVFIVKDWVRSAHPIHWACAFSDRLITGDRVHYRSADELRQMARLAVGDAAQLLEETRIAPWSNNLCLVHRRA